MFKYIAIFGASMFLSSCYQGYTDAEFEPYRQKIKQQCSEFTQNDQTKCDKLDGMNINYVDTLSGKDLRPNEHIIGFCQDGEIKILGTLT